MQLFGQRHADMAQPLHQHPLSGQIGTAEDLLGPDPEALKHALGGEGRRIAAGMGAAVQPTA